MLDSLTVAGIAATICATYGRAMPLAVAQDLTRLLDSHRATDARNLANTCMRNGGHGLAAMIDVELGL